VTGILRMKREYNSKEMLIKSASKIFEYVFGTKKAQNHRNTLCVSRICNAFHAKTDPKDATMHLFGVSLIKYGVML